MRFFLKGVPLLLAEESLKSGFHHSDLLYEVEDFYLFLELAESLVEKPVSCGLPKTKLMHEAWKEPL